ncbi:MAG: 4'-phosphopantetheinyl transferase superfamily protein [Desulfuromonadales bacterium]|nr:4'-phosphopantetheinyl transferase superfamily protein [Desulfuromonadales bacterium]
MPLVLTPWQIPPPKPHLTEQAVHLWRFPLDCHEPLEFLLDDQELQRARRLRVPANAQSFIVARARLRQILGSYLDLAPETLRFSYGPFGKPVLAGEPREVPAFNLAHCGQWGLCAVTRGIEVGVDIERLDRQLDYEKLAAGFFSENERNWLQAASPLRRRRHFFRIWTRKEAWLKGKGGGFSDPDQDIGPAHLAGTCTHDGTWWLKSIPVTRCYLAALALPREISLLQRWSGWHSPD